MQRCSLRPRAGRSLDPELDAGASPLADEPALESISSAAAQGVDLAGPRAGQLTLRVDPTERRPESSAPPAPHPCVRC